jgi:hypothetical protein
LLKIIGSSFSVQHRCSGRTGEKPRRYIAKKGKDMPNQIILLEQLLSKNKEKIAPELNDSDFFELFISEEILKDYNLDYEEIEYGIVGGGDDGGIDSIYAFIENKLLKTDYDFSSVKSEPIIELFIIQSKLSSGFGETAINNLIASLGDLLNLDNEIKDLSKTYNSKLLEIINNYRNAITETSHRFPQLKINFFFATKGESSSVHHKVKRRVNALEHKVKEYFSDMKFNFSFLGAKDIIDLARVQKISSLQLKIVEGVTSEGESIVCLVRLKDYYEFISDKNKNRLTTIFDANVREYEGAVEVNKAINLSLRDKNKELNFWWLNNGITIVATKAPLRGKQLTLEDPKVVNGLQTSQEIWNYFNSETVVDDERLILIRVIVTDNETTRNEIIKATNNQTRILPYSLRATEDIHKDIEQYLSYNGYYYDRQKNYYKNIGKPRSKIVSMQFLAQVIASIILLEPNNARGRPTNLVKDDKKYKKIFNEKYDLKIYLIATKLVNRIDEFMRKDAPEKARNERANLRFHLTSMVVVLKLKSITISVPKFLQNFDLDSLTNEFLEKTLNLLLELFRETKKELNLDSNRVARRKELDKKIFDRLKKVINGDIAF